MELLGATHAEDRGGIARGRLKELVAVGLIQPKATAGSRMLFDPADVDALANRPLVEPPHGRAFVVRIAADSWDPAASEEERVEAVRGWWPCADPDSYIGQHLVVTLQGFILAAYEITGYESGYGRRQFQVKPPGERAAPFVGHRLPSSRGPISYDLPAAN